MQIHDMLKSLLDLLSASNENISKMFKTISVYCEKCGRDIPIQNHEILDLCVLNDENNLQETLNEHLQFKIDDHFLTCHESYSKRMKLSNHCIKTSKDHAFLI